MIARDASTQDIEFVLRHLRPHCRREIFATRFDDDVAHVAEQMRFMARLALVRAALVIEGDSVPAAIFVAYRVSPAAAAFQTFSTVAWPLVAGPCVRWFCHHVVPQLTAAGIRLGELEVLAEPAPDWRWFSLMGILPDGAALPRGRDGERYQRMVWLPPLARPSVDAAGAGLG